MCCLVKNQSLATEDGATCVYEKQIQYTSEQKNKELFKNFKYGVFICSFGSAGSAKAQSAER